jgi:signal transduction histidine kinase
MKEVSQDSSTISQIFQVVLLRESLKFSDIDLERNYILSSWEKNFIIYRQMVWLGAFIYCLFFLLDSWAMPKHFWDAWIVRSVTILCLLFAEILIWISRKKIVFCNLLMTFQISITSMSIPMMTSYATVDELAFTFYTSGVILTYIWSIIYRLPITNLFFYYVISILFHNYLTFFLGNNGKSIDSYALIIADNLLLICSANICLFIAIWRELSYRRHFQLEDALANANNTLADLVKEKTEELRKEKEKSLNLFFEGQEMERTRIAKDLHDELGVRLIALKHRLELLEPTHSDVPALTNQVTLIYKSIRNISHGLYSFTLAKFGLADALKQLCDESNINTNLKITFECPTNFPRLDRQESTHLFRLIQELLANILKHSNATLATISLFVIENEIVLTVNDNGNGFTVEIENKANWGLNNVRERAELLGGQVYFQSNQETGTNITLKVPL